MAENSEHLFPREREVDSEYGVEIGCNWDDLARAVAVWVHAQPKEQVTVGEAAMLFHVRPEFLVEVFAAWGNPFFWIQKAPIPAANRIFEADGL